jgi:hypothetical protein
VRGALRAGRVLLLAGAVCALLHPRDAGARDPAPPAPPPAVSDDPGCGTLSIVESDGTVVYRLPRTFLTSVADSAWTRSGTLRQPADYIVDRMRGELRLLRAPVPGETLRVAACWLLAPPALEYQQQSYVPARPALKDSMVATLSAPPARPVTSRDPSTAPSGAALTVNGNKTIAVDFGSSQDAFLRQSLDLSVSGNLAPGVQLTGVLSDRSTPLTSSGSTQDLQALDNVLLELKAPVGGAAFGDVALDVRQGEFGRVERRLQGMRADWNSHGFAGTVAAASAQGEFNRMQFYGVDGQQGPYLLTDRNGGTAITIVAGSEVVTVDGVRMTRGEAADYSIEYDGARITFSNRRPITAASRITVDYQYTLNRYRRNFAAAGGQWDRGGLKLYTEVLSESDDRSRPLDLALDPSDRLALSMAGDSLARAVGPGVTAGGGDYDTVRVAGRLIYAFAGPDSGQFSVRFVQVGTGHGDYADSAGVAGRIVYHYTGPGAGDWTIGHALPMPETHQLWTMGGRWQKGALAVEAEGAASRHDLNSASPLDDRDNNGMAGKLALSLEGSPGRLGRAGVTVLARDVDQRFAAFGRLEQPFSNEDWGLPLGGDLEHQRRIEANGFLRPAPGGQLRWMVAALRTPDHFSGLRRTVDWSNDGRLMTRASYERSDGSQEGLRFTEGGRERAQGEMRLRTAWVLPGVRVNYDLQRTPSDSAQIATRAREAGVDLQSGTRLAWRAAAGVSLRRDGSGTPDSLPDQTESRTVRFQLDSPPERMLAVGSTWQRRDVRPITSGAIATAARSDLASVRLGLEDPARGLSGSGNVEVTTEGQSQQARSLVYAGPGLGAYDALGNFVGRGDYNLGITILPGLQHIARAATSAHAGWTFGQNEIWHGSRVEFSFETDARRQGELKGSDMVVSPGAVLGDPNLIRGSVLQRLESDLAPGARVSNLHLLLERRVTADRSFDNFSQSQDERTGQLRWRARVGAMWSAELESRVRRREAAQQLFAGAQYQRTLIEQGGSGQWIFQPGSKLRAAAVVDASWSRPEGQPSPTRTLQVGPDASFAVGARGRADVSVRRAFVDGPPAVSLLPTVDPAGAPQWNATSHLDVRVHDSTTLGGTYVISVWPNLPTRAQGRVELRAFF